MPLHPLRLPPIIAEVAAVVGGCEGSVGGVGRAEFGSCLVRGARVSAGRASDVHPCHLCFTLKWRLRRCMSGDQGGLTDRSQCLDHASIRIT